jgi:hypothetical protein
LLGGGVGGGAGGGAGGGVSGGSGVVDGEGARGTRVWCGTGTHLPRHQGPGVVERGEVRYAGGMVRDVCVLCGVLWRGTGDVHGARTRS